MVQTVTQSSCCSASFMMGGLGYGGSRNRSGFRTRISFLERNLCILMLGLDNAGKTCTARSLVGESLDTVAPTVGFSKVSTRYKGFRVDIHDLGGSRSFRGIWPKYYHEAHGFIFVVDASSDEGRMEETSQVLQATLAHPRVQGKPLLMLCNKADADEAKDEVHIVNELEVERLVNEARCPTRVELSVANRNHGLRDGFKWLLKSVIAQLPELGPRVEADVEEERLREDRHRAQVRLRLEGRQRGKLDDDEEDGSQQGSLPGFVPIHDLLPKMVVPSVAPLPPEETSSVTKWPLSTLSPIKRPFRQDHEDDDEDDGEGSTRSGNRVLLPPISKAAEPQPLAAVTEDQLAEAAEAATEAPCPDSPAPSRSPASSSPSPSPPSEESVNPATSSSGSSELASVGVEELDDSGVHTEHQTTDVELDKVSGGQEEPAAAAEPPASISEISDQTPEAQGDPEDGRVPLPPTTAAFVLVRNLPKDDDVHALLNGTKVSELSKALPKLDLEPVSRVKKRGVLRKLQSDSSSSSTAGRSSFQIQPLRKQAPTRSGSTDRTRSSNKEGRSTGSSNNLHRRSSIVSVK